MGEASSRQTRRRTATLWISVVAFWGFVTLLYAANLWWLSTRPGERINLRMALIWQGAYYLTWIPFTMGVWRLTRDWQPERFGWPAYLGRHLALGALVTVLHTALVVAVAWPGAAENESMLVVIGRQIRGRVHLELLIYAAIVGVGQSIAFHDRYRERQLAAARLEAELSTARLQALRAQLQPHFLFNSLHSIASLARAGDNAAVVRLIAGLSDLLRHGLDASSDRQALADEMALVEKYLDIQRVRFGDRLTATVAIEPDVAGARVPPLIVQPLVENALRHGVGPMVGPGTVTIRAFRDGASAVIEVDDDGVGLPAGWTAERTAGTGLRNLGSRLAAEYGDSFLLSLTPRPSGGARAVVRLPGGWS